MLNMKKLEDAFFQKRDATLSNLFLYPTRELGEYAKSENSQANRIACVAELFVREFLKKESAEKEINSILKNGELNDFWLTVGPLLFSNGKNSSLLLRSLWGAMGEMNDFSSKCQVAVRKRMTILCERTDGFIPVYEDNGNDVFFIPFHFVETENICAVIVDQAGRPVENWIKPCTRVFRLAEKHLAQKPKYQCVISCDQTGLPAPLTGNSLMLPLYLAYLRIEKALLYNPLRALFTGAIDDFGFIAPVETLKKTIGCQSKFDGAFFYFPETSKYTPSELFEVALPKMDLPHLQRRIQADIEARGLYILKYREAKERLKVLAKDHDVKYIDWNNQLNRLRSIIIAFDPSRQPEEYLLCLMLESSLLCHMGKTTQALEKNRKAQSFAKEKKLNRQLLRLQIDEMVEFQDMEDFTALAPFAERLEFEIENNNDPDLLMRYYGTMGQAHCFGFLSGEKGFSKEKAKEHFDKAVKYACQKANMEENPDAENDIAQDYNYVFMWYALFEPESDASRTAYTLAENQIKKLLEDDEDGGNNNLIYLKQYRGLSLYRYLLQKNTLARTHHEDNAVNQVELGLLSEINEEDYLLVAEKDGWQAALSGKYVGAIKAAKGKIEEAKAIFEKYIRILYDAEEQMLQTGGGENNDVPVLCFIQMTILAEAFRSTSEAHYCERASALAEQLLLEYPNTVPAWKKYLLGQGEFPGLKYWR